MTRDKDQFAWLWEQSVYEPPPLEYARPAAPLTLKVFAALCILAVIGGTLWAFNN